MDYTPMHLINQLTIELSCMMPSNITFFLRKWMLYHLAWFLTKPKNLSKRKSFWRLDLGVIRAWRRHFILFQTISAQCEKEPCCDWVGDEGAGHFVKMVHNGIEYGDMQLIAGLASGGVAGGAGGAAAPPIFWHLSPSKDMMLTLFFHAIACDPFKFQFGGFLLK